MQPLRLKPLASGLKPFCQDLCGCIRRSEAHAARMPAVSAFSGNAFKISGQFAP